MLAGHLVVDFAHYLVLIDLIGVSKLDLAARIERARGKPRCNVQCRFDEKRWIEPVVDEGRSQRDLAPRIARRRRKSREVSPQHRRCRHKRERLSGIRARYRALIATKE